MNYIKLFGIAAFAIGVILYLASAEDHEVVVGDQEYDLGEYIKVSVNTTADVNVKVGHDYGLNVIADKRDLKNLRIYVKGQTLVIENKKNIFQSWHGTTPEISISMPKLKKFTLNGSSDARIEGVYGRYFKAVVNGSGHIDMAGASDELKVEVNGSGSLSATPFNALKSEVEINGSGSVSMEGECTSLEVEVNGSGEFAGREFKCDHVEVDIAGSGDLEVYASNMLDVDVIGSGEIDVYGDPKHVKDWSRRKTHVNRH